MDLYRESWKFYGSVPTTHRAFRKVTLTVR